MTLCKKTKIESPPKRVPLWVLANMRTPDSPLVSTRASVRAFFICLEKVYLAWYNYYFAAICLEKVDLVWYNCDFAKASSSVGASLSYRLNVYVMLVYFNCLRLWNTSQQHECNTALAVQRIVCRTVSFSVLLWFFYIACALVDWVNITQGYPETFLEHTEVCIQ